MAISTPRIAAAYIRVSTEDQTEFSPAAQLRELQDYAAAHCLVLDQRYVYADEGISGRKAEKRPAFMQMISDAKRQDHPFEVILVHKFDRFARSREDSIVYKSMLKRVGVEVISIKEPLADGAYSGVMESIYESFAEAYSINLGTEVRKGMTEKALRGEPQTAPPFGYRIENKKFYPHDVEAPIVRQIFERFSSGEALFSIARWLNSQGITTHRGSHFENRTVEYILRNPVYIGMLRWNPKRRSRRNYTDPDIITAQAKHEPIIDRALWEQVQTRMAYVKSCWRYHGRPNYERKHWLCGIVRCSACDATLVFSKPHFLMCNGYAHGKCLSTQHIAVEELEDAMLRLLRRDLESSEPLRCKILQTAAPSDHSVISQTLDRLRKKLSRLTEAYLAEAIPLPEYQKIRARLEEEMKEAEDALVKAAEAPAVDATPVLMDGIRAALCTLESDATIPEKFDALNSIVDHCTFDRSNSLLTVTYRVSV